MSWISRLWFILAIVCFYGGAIIAIPLEGDTFYPGLVMITFTLVGAYVAGVLAEHLSSKEEGVWLKGRDN